MFWKKLSSSLLILSIQLKRERDSIAFKLKSTLSLSTARVENSNKKYSGNKAISNGTKGKYFIGISSSIN